MNDRGLLRPELADVVCDLVRLGVALTLVGVVGGVATVVSQADAFAGPRVLFAACLAVILVGAVAAWRTDWAAALRDGTATPRAVAWTLSVLAPSVLNAMIGVVRPGAWLYFAVIGTYFAVLLPRVAAGVLGVATAASGVVVELAVGGDPAMLVTVALGTVMLVAISHGVASTTGALAVDARRRAAALATVATSARAVQSLDTAEVPRRVAEATLALGFDGVTVTERVGEDTHVTVHRGGRLIDGLGGLGPTVLGDVSRRVVETRRLVVVEHYDRTAAPNPALRAAGIRALVAMPVVVEDEVVGVLHAASVDPTLDPVRLESVELLGGMLAQALSNASRFAAERRAVDALDELARMKDDFVSNVSHELRTPITVVLGALQTIRDRGDRLDDGLRDDLLRRAMLNGQELQTALEALLDFARSAGEAVDEPTDVGDVVAAAVARLEDLLRSHPLEVVADPDCCVAVPPPRLARVVDNLLLNAANHTPPGTPVRVTATRVDDQVELVVEDDGPGIPHDELPRVTDRFYRGGDGLTRSTRGLGIGLSLVERILREHGGTLDVVSEFGRGSTFTCRLPRAV